MNLTFGQCVLLVIIAFAAKEFFTILRITLGVFLQIISKVIEEEKIRKDDEKEKIGEELDRAIRKEMEHIDVTKYRKIGFVSNRISERDS